MELCEPLSHLCLTEVTFKHNLSKEALFHESIANDRGRTRLGGPFTDQKSFPTKLGVQGPLLYYTDPTCTGRPVNDTFAVAWPEIKDDIWWKDSLKAFDPDQYQGLLKRVVDHLNQCRASLYVQDVYAGTDPSYAVPYRFVGEYAVHAMFAQNMFPKQVDGIEKPESKLWTMLNVQSFTCDPERDGSLSERAAIIDFKNRLCLIAGRADYCGLVKKTIFTVMNFLLPKQGFLSMHCSGNIGPAGDTAILFGLSGTGKTTLSADPDRALIGDDEHGWDDDGIFNFEGGCYAKTIDLDANKEPEIYNAIRRNALLENVVIKGNVPDYFDNSKTENTRVSYPIEHIENRVLGISKAGHAKKVIFLTADAFGVFPPVSRLTSEQAKYHYLSGFTAKLAGTERGVTHPTPTFSSCFGQAFLSLHPTQYAEVLEQRMADSGASAYLVNTGWNGTGKRISLADTRAIINAILSGEVEDSECEILPYFDLAFPTTLTGVDSHILDPRNTYSNVNKWDKEAKQLAALFISNFTKFTDNEDGKALTLAGPHL